MYPTLAALVLPGFGSMHRELLHQCPHIGATIVVVKKINSAGQVTVSDHGCASILYTLREKDLKYLKQGVAIAAWVQFAAGAKRVMTLHDRLTRFNSRAEIDTTLATWEWGMNQVGLYSAHPLGTCGTGNDPKRSVVDEHCQTHDVKGLFVIDGSVTPMSLGVNPQITILAIAEKSAEWIAGNIADIEAS